MPRALLVDDDANSLEALAELINQEGFTTSTASTLGEARQLMDEITPAVVLTDLMLPDGSGLELVEISGTIGAQVVLITGHASVETAVEALRRGATDYLTKPIDLPRLKAILANVGTGAVVENELCA
jgi:DNA-binding NtrC family response regulator